MLTEVSKFVQILCSDRREHPNGHKRPKSTKITSPAQRKSLQNAPRSERLTTFGKQGKCVGVTGLDGTEVSAVVCRDFGHSESFSNCDEACGSFPKWEVGVLLNELCHALGVSRVEIDRDQFSRCE